MVDQRFHRPLHLAATRGDDLVVLDHHRLAGAVAQLVNALLHDPHRLLHLFDAHQIAVPAVAVLADDDVELQLGIALIGLRLAQVPGDVRAAQHDAGEAPFQGLLLGHHADVDVALLEDAVLGNEAFDVLQRRRELVAPAADVVDQVHRQVLVDAAGTEIVGVQTGAAGALVEHHQLLALLEAPERRRQGADVHGLGRHVQHVRQDATDFRIQDADQLRPVRNLDAQQLLDGQAEGVLLVHRRDIVQPVQIRHVLQIGARLHQLFGAAVQQADVRIDALDDLAVQLQHQAQHAVGGRVLRAEVDGELAVFHFARVGGAGVQVVVEHIHAQRRHGGVSVSHYAWPPAFSSPGRTGAGYSAPSHGDRKSNVRNSCVSLTGS